MPEKQLSPVFYDPQRRRWRRFKLSIQLVAGLLSIIFGGLAISIIYKQELPSLGLEPVRNMNLSRKGLPPVPKPWLPSSKERLYEQTRANLKDYLAEVKSEPVVVSKTPPSGKSEVIGFFVDWEDTSFTSLKENIGKMDKLMPEWYHLTDGDGTFVQDNPARQDLVQTFIHEHRPALPVCPIVNNFNPKIRHWEDQKLAQMLGNPDNRERSIQRLLNIIQSNNFAGISIDFEAVPDESQPNLNIFMRDLYNRFHALGLEVSESVPFDDESYEYKTLAQSSDFLILMAYDQHDSNGEPGPRPLRIGMRLPCTNDSRMFRQKNM